MGGVKLDDTIRRAVHDMLTARPPRPRARRVRQRKTAGLWAKPFESDALGVRPDQIPAATAALREHGVLTEFNEQSGAAIISSAKQYRETARAIGLYNGRDGYGVPNDSGGLDATGREPVLRREATRRALLAGDYDD